MSDTPKVIIRGKEYRVKKIVNPALPNVARWQDIAAIMAGRPVVVLVAPKDGGK